MVSDINPLCLRCKGACCKHLLFPAGNSPEFWEARSLDVIDGYVAVPSKCPHLTDEGLCDDYENRPRDCYKFRVGNKFCQMAMKVEKRKKGE
jgi:hypothetical protein